MLALAVSLALASSGCEKHPPAPTQPSDPAGPTEPTGVIVEQPGSDPVESAPGEAGDEPGDSGDVGGQTKIVATDVPCQRDDDCVKASCCHASTCVARADAPDCSQSMCTADCQAGTMDCNGGCLCQAGKCAAKLWVPPTGS